MPSGLARVPRDWPHRKHSRSIAVGALRWHVQIAGQGPTVLLLHGTGASAHSWADLLPLLVDHATVVAPDLPGHGYTHGAPLEILTMTRIASDLEALVEAIDVPPVTVVVGHSAGAPLSILWSRAARCPPKFLLGFNPSLVPPPDLYNRLLAPVVNPFATSIKVTNWLAAMAGRSWLVGGLLDSTRSTLPARQRARYARLFNDPAHVRGAMGFMAGTDLQGFLDALILPEFPMKFVLGAQDHWVPRRPLQRVLSRHFPRVDLETWEGGHLLHEEYPARAAALIRDTLERVKQNGPP